MCIQRPLLALLVLAMFVSCDADAPSEYPLRPHGLSATWCAETSEFTWTLDVGLAADAPRDSEPLAWPGGMSYTASAQGAGGGGGRGRSCCGIGSASGKCAIAPEQQRARHWRVSERSEFEIPPHTLSVHLDTLPGHMSRRFRREGPALDLEFSLGPPASPGTDGCVSLPVTKITENALSPVQAAP